MDFIERLAPLFADNAVLAIVLAGVVLLFFGAKGSSQKAIKDKPWRIVVGGVGIVLILSGLVYLPYEKSKSITSCESYGIKIEHPRGNSEVQAQLNQIFGAFTKEPPKGLSLHIVSSEQVGQQTLYWPKALAGFEKDSRRWKTGKIYTLGKPAQEVDLIAFLVGHDGRALIDYHSRVGKETGK